MTQRQRTFFDDELARDDALKRGVPATDPNVRPQDAPRLTGQNLAILQRLRQGSATNAELAAISLKYTSRVSDLRKAGHVIHCTRAGDGLTVYKLGDRNR